MDRRLSVSSCVLLLAAVAAPAAAQSRPFDRGLRIGLATDLVARGEQTTTSSSSFGSGSSTLGTTSYGLGLPRLGIDLGGFPIPYLGVGVALSVGQAEQGFTSTGSSSFSERDSLEYGVLPYAEGRIPLLDILSLQLRLNVGVVGTEQTERGSGSSSVNVLETTQFAIGAQAGLHVFAAESFSISPYVGFRYTTGDANSTSGFSGSVSNFGVESWQVVLGVALFGWIDLTGGGELEDIEPIEEVPVRQPQPVQAVAPVQAAAPSAEPVVAGDVMATALVIPGAASARVLGNVTTGDARIDLRTSGAQPRFASCTEALLASDLGSAMVPARVQATQTLTGIDEAVVLTGRPEQLDALRGENARIELCGVRIDIDAANRYRIGRLLAALRMASPAAHGPGPAAQTAPAQPAPAQPAPAQPAPAQPAPGQPAAGLTAP